MNSIYEPVIHTHGKDLFFSFMEYIFSSLINFKIEVLSLGTDFKSCANECSQLKGHVPYTFEGERHLTSTDWCASSFSLQLRQPLLQ